MKIKLIDVETTEDNDVTFGTCEMCMSYGHTTYEPVYIFQLGDDEDNLVKVDGYWWSWGDYSELMVDNVIAFADYISQQEFPDDTELTYGWLEYLTWDYQEWKGGHK